MPTQSEYKMGYVRFFVTLETVSLHQALVLVVVHNFLFAKLSTGHCCSHSNNDPHIQSFGLQYQGFLVLGDIISSSPGVTGRPTKLCIPAAILKFALLIGPATGLQQEGTITTNSYEYNSTREYSEYKEKTDDASHILT